MHSFHATPVVDGLSVVIPIHNEAGNIEPLFLEIEQALSHGEGALMPWEVLFVDDASDDNSLAELKALKTRYASVRIFQQTRCQGQSTAVHIGVQQAAFSWVVTLDGDGQNDPADIPKLLQASQGKPGLVIGHRAHRQDTWLKRFSSCVANGVRRAFLQDNTPDSGCGLKLFPKEAFLKLPYFDHMHRFTPALFRRLDLPVISVVVHHRPRQQGISKYGLHNRLWVGLVDLLGVFWLMQRKKHFCWKEVE